MIEDKAHSPICSAKCLVHCGNLWTFELRYPRYIHSEFMTHRMFSRNASSSRAIPVGRVIEQVENDPVIPPKVYLNQKGMVGEVRASQEDTREFRDLWLEAAENAVGVARAMQELGIHKQHINRILEPFQYIKVIVTATEWSNFFILRLAPDAQPEMRELAECIYEEMYKNSLDEKGFITTTDGRFVTLPYVTPEDIQKIGKDDPFKLMKISAARCARVSYNNHDGSAPDIEKDLKLFEKLKNSQHASPLEHTCMSCEDTEIQFFANLYGWKSLRYIYHL